MGSSEGVRERTRVQRAAGGGEHRRAGHRVGAARIQADRRDPVLRLHLAGIHAASKRAVDDALALERRIQLADGRTRDLWRLYPRRDLSLADGRFTVYSLPGTARRG